MNKKGSDSDSPKVPSKSSADKMIPLVSVSTVYFNEARYVDLIAQSLSGQSHKNLEFLFIDNGSTDGAFKRLKELFPVAKFIELDENIGFARAHNLGIENSQGKYILTLNMDILLERDYISELVKGMESSDAIGSATGKIYQLIDLRKTDNIDNMGHHLYRYRCVEGVDYTKPWEWEGYSRKRFVFGATGCAALYRREMLEDIKIGDDYFDGDYFIFFEDVDLDWRAQLAGWKCLYVPDAVAHHERGGSGQTRKSHIAALFLTNRFLTIIKNDQVTHFLADIFEISKRTVEELHGAFSQDPMIVVLALKRFLAKLPAALRKRRYIQSRMRVSASYIRSMFI